VPEDVQIPFTILWEQTWDIDTVQTAVADGRLPTVAMDVVTKGEFKDSRLSIYAHAWAENLVTITSNKEIRSTIRNLVEANRRADDEVGPRIWPVDMTRNMLSKNAAPRPWMPERDT
jgi:hypothetical protein